MPDLSPEEPYASATRIDLDAVPLAVIRFPGRTLDDIDDIFDAAYRELNTAVSGGLLDQAGPCLAVYHGNPSGPFDVEVGMPVLAAPPAPIESAVGPPVTGSELPAGPALAQTHIGSYTTLGGAWQALVAAAADERPTETWVEVYVTEPGEAADEQLRTDLLLMLEPSGR